MLEALIFAAAAAATPPPAKPQKTAQAPAAELLEFIGDWPEDEARRFLDAGKDADHALPALDGNHDGHQEQKESGHDR